MGQTTPKQQVVTLPTKTVEVPANDAGHEMVFAVRQCGGSYKLFKRLDEAHAEGRKQDAGVKTWLLL